jgi:hypothetical protein
VTVSLLGHIHRYQVDLDADLNAITESLAGSVAYSFESQSCFVWDVDSWEAYTYPLLDAVSPNLPSVDEKAALSGAASPDATNVLATMADLDPLPTDIVLLGQYIEGTETAAPAAPAANKGRIFFRDTGGKTELCVRFPTGAIQQIAIEP